MAPKSNDLVVDPAPQNTKRVNMSSKNDANIEDDCNRQTQGEEPVEAEEHSDDEIKLSWIWIWI